MLSIVSGERGKQFTPPPGFTCDATLAWGRIVEWSIQRQFPLVHSVLFLDALIFGVPLGGCFSMCQQSVAYFVLIHFSFPTHMQNMESIFRFVSGVSGEM